MYIEWNGLAVVCTNSGVDTLWYGPEVAWISSCVYTQLYRQDVVCTSSGLHTQWYGPAEVWVFSGVDMQWYGPAEV